MSKRSSGVSKKPTKVTVISKPSKVALVVEHRVSLVGFLHASIALESSQSSAESGLMDASFVREIEELLGHSTLEASDPYVIVSPGDVQVSLREEQE